MNNEPVAYKAWHKDLGWTYHDWKDGFTSEGVIPLYTHPADLTDEEILDIWYEFNNGSYDWTEFVKFARAILRKASEK